MGLAIRIPGVTFTRYIDRAVPYLDEAVGYYLFGTDEATSILNWVPGASVDLTVSGTPTYGDGYVALDATTDYFTTGINVIGSQTLLVACQMPTNTEAVFAPAAGAGLTMRGAGVGGLRLDCSVGGGGTPLPSHAVGSDYMLCAGSVAGTTGSFNKCYTSAVGVVTETIVTSGGGLVGNLGSTTGGYKIGPSAAPGGGTGMRFAAAMIFDTQRTQAEIEEVFEYWQFALPKRGSILLE